MHRLEFRPAGEGDLAKAEAFNQRLAAAGEPYHRLSLRMPFRTMVHRQESPIKVEKLLCLDGDEIRGAVGLKRMPFRVNRRSAEVAVAVYPISEGIVNPDYALVGLMLQKELLRRYPLMYSLGSASTSPAKLKRYTGWYGTPVPFHFKIFHPEACLRNIAYLRRKLWLRLVLDVAALSGAGRGALALLDLVQHLRGRYPRAGQVRVERVDVWGDWADQVWLAARDCYALIGDRSQTALQHLYPSENKYLIKLCFTAAASGRVLGWAVITASRLTGHKYFGSMRLGAIVDLLALPEDAEAVASASLVAVRQAGADLAVVNHSDERWNRAFERAGMWPWKSNFWLYLSPKLSAQFRDPANQAGQFYFTRGDGHGPTQFWWGDETASLALESNGRHGAYA